ncbi:AraC family transcriptional regulator [Paenibacillus sp. GCM10012306]|uniref:AraC family transcriptional regulator n=1 Tax=Paenibacillus sp. GCM10012306 TaxID=3317342 RepID=UPI003606AA7F
MNNRNSLDLQHFAAGHFYYKLLDVVCIKDHSSPHWPERKFLETESHVLLLSSSDRGRLVIDGHFHPIHASSLFVCTPGQLVEVTNYSGSELELLLLYFQVQTLPLEKETSKSTRTDVTFPFHGEAMISPSSAVTHLYDIIKTHWSNKNSPSAQLRCEAGLLELLSLVLGYQEQQTALALESARLELERHYQSDITIDSLAGIAGLSRFHFMRLFKERYGRGVMEYRTDLRLMEAKRLLDNPDSPSISSIAYQIGYKSETYFSSLFKKQTGLAPAVYQRNQKCRVAAYSWINFGQLLALQIIPFAAPIDHYWTDYYRIKYKYEVKVPLSHQYNFNWEALKQAKPHYIIGMDSLIPPEEQVRLEGIAPLLLLPSGASWRQHLCLIAEFLGRTNVALKWLSHYDRKAVAIREQLQPMIGQDSLLVVLISGDQLYVWGKSAGTVFYDDLRFSMPPAVAEFDWKKPIEAHELQSFSANRIIVHLNEDPVSQTLWTKLLGSDAWNRLQAVREHKIHLITGYSWFEAPWGEYAADHFDRFISMVPGIFAVDTGI